MSFNPFAGPEIVDVIPTTEAEQEIWNACQLGDDASLAYNEGLVFDFQGPIDAQLLQEALWQVVERHDALRSTFSADGHSRLVNRWQVLPFDELSSVSDPRTAEQQMIARPFDLIHGPLVNFCLLALPNGEQRLVFVAHHLVCDGWSAAVFAKDLMRIYLAKENNTELPLRAVPTPQDRTEADDLAYWSKIFSQGVPEWDIPTDGIRPKLMTYGSERIDIEIDPILRKALLGCAAKNNASIFHLFFAAYQIWISRLSGTADFVVGVPTAGQAALDCPERIGHFVHLLPFLCSPVETELFPEFLKRVRSQVLDGLEHQLFTYGTLLKELKVTRQPSRPSLVPVMFNFDQSLDMSAYGTPERKVALRSIPRVAENFEIFLNVADDGTCLHLEYQYKTDLFSRENMIRWIASFNILLEEIASNPSRPLGAMPWLSPALEAEALARATGARQPYPKEKKIHELLSDNAQNFPDLCAYRCSGNSISYKVLNQRADAVAVTLMEQGITSSDFIGVSLKRGIDMMVAMFGILKAGASYVPLDPTFPEARLADMIEAAKIPLILTDSDSIKSLPLTVRTLEVSKLPTMTSVVVPTTTGTSAYVIFTSGSTGKPKGVHVAHATVMNLLFGLTQLVPFTEKDTLAAVVTISFDMALFELYLPLLTQTPVVIVERDIVQDGLRLRSLLAEENVNILQATPPLWKLLLSAGWEGRPDFLAVSGGEPLTKDLAQELLPLVDQLWNMYGPTEVTVYAAVGRITNLDITIGHALPNTTALVLDAHMNLVPPGVAGELWAGGDGVALGYLNQPGLTAERFVESKWGRLYRTGDRCRVRIDGRIEYHGRLDAQVKVRGYRIELGEIEYVLAQHKGVSACVVMAREDRPGDVRLVAYIVGETAGAKEYLATKLPEYMIPQHYVVVETFPLTGSGKIDRRALPAPLAPMSRTVTPPKGPLELSLHELWTNLFGQCGVEDNFFELGGHSLLATQVISTLRKNHQILIGLKEIFLYPTIRSLAEHLKTKSTSKVSNPVRREGSKDFPVTLMQESVTIFSEMHENSTAFNLPSAFLLLGTLDIQALKKAVNAFICRHEILHSEYYRKDGNLYQKIKPFTPVDFALLDFSTDPQPMTKAHEWMLAKTNTPMDIFIGPHFAFDLLKLKDDEHVIFWLPHMLVWDGWSFDLFVTEVSHLYTTFTANNLASPSQLQTNPLRYVDYCHWHKEFLCSDHVTEQWAHWEHHLSKDIEPCRLGGPEFRKTDFKGGDESVTLNNEDVTALTNLAASHGSSLYQFLMGIFGITMATLEGRETFWMATPVRNRSHDEFEHVVGSFVNTIPVKFELEATALASILRTKDLCLESLAHGDIPFADLVGRFSSGNASKQRALTQFLFSFQDVRGRPTAFGPLKMQQVEVFNPQTTTEFRMWFKQKNGALLAGADFMCGVHSTERVLRFLEIFRTNLTMIVNDPQIAVRLLESSLCRSEFSFVAPKMAGKTLTEIESVVTAIEGITEAQSGWINGEAAICYVTDGQTNNAQIRRVLREHFGDLAFKLHAVPQKCPRDEEGQIELQLKIPRAAIGTEESMLSHLWQELLGLERITVNQRFFDLGGRSLQALQMIQRIHDQTGKKLHPTVFLQNNLEQIAVLMGAQA